MVFLLICLVFGLPIPVLCWSIHHHQAKHKQRARLGFILFALLAALLAALFLAGLSYEPGAGNQ
jgi:hypothetical protein